MWGGKDRLKFAITSSAMKKFYLMLIAITVHGGLSAQQEIPETSPLGPRWGVGIEMLRPAYGLVSDHDHMGRGVQSMLTYPYRENRSWRLGHGFLRYQHRGSGSSISDTIMVQRSNSLRSNYHIFSMGQQWSFTKGRVRPIAGLDVIVAHLHHRAKYYEAEHLRDTIGGDVVWSRETGPSVMRNRVKEDHLWAGLGGSVGVQYRAHPHLLFQLRVNVAYLREIDIRPRRSTYPIGHNGFTLPPIGTGLFVQFLF
jgi:hypothetical protein